MKWCWMFYSQTRDNILQESLSARLAISPSSPLVSSHLLNDDLNSTPPDSDILQNSFLSKSQLFFICMRGEIENRAVLKKRYQETSILQ